MSLRIRAQREAADAKREQERRDVEQRALNWRSAQAGVLRELDEWSQRTGMPVANARIVSTVIVTPLTCGSDSSLAGSIRRPPVWGST
jgi:hypothetical protein